MYVIAGIGPVYAPMLDVEGARDLIALRVVSRLGASPDFDPASLWRPTLTATGFESGVLPTTSSSIEISHPAVDVVMSSLPPRVSRTPIACSTSARSDAAGAR